MAQMLAIDRTRFASPTTLVLQGRNYEEYVDIHSR